MELSIEHIEQEMLRGELTPRQVSEFRTYLAAYYSLKSGELQQILLVKPQLWLRLRERKKSDTAAEREWEGTELGLKELMLKYELKRIDKLTSALTAVLTVLEGERRNQY